MNPTRSLLACALASLLLAGCAGSQGPTNPTPNAAANVYIVSGTLPAQIEAIPANSTGSAAAVNTITIPGLNYATALAIDSSGNIYAATATDIREYTAGSTGTAAPIRTIPFDATTTLTDSFSIAVDAAGNIYAAQFSGSGSQTIGSILVFASTANGSVAPIRTIAGALTGIVLPEQLALDASGNLYVFNANPATQAPILVFAPGATGNVAPIRSLNGSFLPAMAVDSAGDIYTLPFTGGINIYASGASGSATPAQTVNTLSLGDPAFSNGLAVDSSGNIYYTSNGTLLNGARTAVPAIYRISPPAGGSSTVLNSFTPADWSTQPGSIAYFIAVH